MLARPPAVADAARPSRRTHAHQRQCRRHGGLDRRGVRRSQIPALHGTLLPQRASQGPQIQRSRVAAMLNSIRAMESRGASRAKAESAADELESMGLKKATKVIRERFAETLTYRKMPRKHWRRICTNNAIERLNRENQAACPRRRYFPRWKVNSHASGRPLEIRRRQQMGLPPLLGHVSAQEAAVPAASRKLATVSTAPSSRRRRFSPLCRSHSLVAFPGANNSSMTRQSGKLLLERANAEALTATHANDLVNPRVQKTVAIRNHANGTFWTDGVAGTASAALRIIGEQDGDLLFHHLPSTPLRNFLTALLASHFLDDSNVDRRYSPSRTPMPSSLQRSSTTSRDPSRGEGRMS